MKTEIFKNVLFSILPNGEPGHLIDFPEGFDDKGLLEGYHLEDNFTNLSKLPKEKGVYSCDVQIDYFPGCYPDFEADMDMIAINIKKLI